VIVEGDLATVEFRRRFSHPPETVGRALTDPREVAGWYLATGRIDPRLGGRVELVAGPSHLQVTGEVLAWDPPQLLEHEWKVAPRPELPAGENAVIRWELRADEVGTLLHLTHRNLSRRTAIGFAPGTHAFLDRLAAHLDGAPLPDWSPRYGQVAPQYPPGWTSR
jgi:uncharacterized protein YndB with AHSA1/START domain